MKAILLILALTLQGIYGNVMAETCAAPDSEEALATSISSVGLTEAATAVTALPLELTAVDFITKVYGVLDTNLSEQKAMDEAKRSYNLTPAADSTGLWLDTADGYVVSYYGMTPYVSAVAHFDSDGASDYSYFFIFPYASGRRGAADYEQCAFSGSLLQEMQDVGLIVGVPDTTDSIFEAMGSYEGNHVNVRLVEEELPDNSGRFILMLAVTPGAYTISDEFVADRH